MSNRTRLKFHWLHARVNAALGAIIAMLIVASASSAADVRVLHVESIAISGASLEAAASTVESIDNARKSRLAISGEQQQRVQIAAFGRQFEFQLESHTQLDRIAANNGASARAYRGKLSGNEASWVRLTATHDGVHGIVWDGTELYAIEPAAEVDKASNPAPSGTVIFRLADTLTDLGPNSCAAIASDAPASGAALYNSISGEIKTAQSVSSAVLQLQLSAVMDAAFREQYSSDTQAADAIIARINNVDGIFSAQLGVSIALKYVAPVATAGNSPISATTDPSSLLANLGRYRAGNINLSSTGITHLFTGRDMDGNTVGISYIDAVCNANYGDTLSESRGRGTWFDSLIAAHELGHSFGAPHDGDAGCATTGGGFLMAATLNGSDQFSQCSRDTIQRRVQSASCLNPIPVGDISIAPDLGTKHAAIDESFDWSFTVMNSGSAMVSGGRVQMNVPGSLRVASMHADNGSCTQGAGVVVCTLDAIEVSGTRNVGLRLQSSLAGAYQISAVTSATANADTSNDSGAANIVIDAPAQSNAGVTPVATPTPTSTIAPTTSTGSGGGAFQLDFIALLALLFCLGRRRATVSA